MRLKNSKKLNIFMKLYRAGIRPNYVDILKNKNDKAMLSKLRISAHKLAMECGRYLNIPKHERICKAFNSGEEEDEEHFLLKCSLNKPLRQVLCSKLVKFNHQCVNLKIILDNHDHYLLKMSSNLSKNVLIKEKLPSLKSYVFEELSSSI